MFPAKITIMSHWWGSHAPSFLAPGSMDSGICFALAATSIFLQNSAVPPLVLVTPEEGRITKSYSLFLLGEPVPYSFLFSWEF